MAMIASRSRSPQIFDARSIQPECHHRRRSTAGAFRRTLKDVEAGYASVTKTQN
ncbi:uncharacterized protein RAG0_10478 [Rhynchosporium agropyri]|uniref:Uncharacterized protein n=2 Tax=Rhynchosporium TaxID=38037 RepID=A0A1E1LYL5_RHYSE|nr:uncharacterized protein RAG0_10478 [Rhynchosporium agropyri]CZT41938.1 uncharacterized protein RSE6_01759 [Rhynchosporium secalis]